MDHPRPHAADDLNPGPTPQRQIGPWEVLSTWTQHHPEDRNQTDAERPPAIWTGSANFAPPSP